MEEEKSSRLKIDRENGTGRRFAVFLEIGQVMEKRSSIFLELVDVSSFVHSRVQTLIAIDTAFAEMLERK